MITETVPARATLRRWISFNLVGVLGRGRLHAVAALLTRVRIGLHLLAPTVGLQRRRELIEGDHDSILP